MGILSRTTIIAALFTGASALHAFEQRTVWFNIPSSGSQPLTSDPGPITTTSFGPGQGSEWLTWDSDSLLRMGLPNDVGGLKVPNIGSLWDLLNVPVGLRDSLVSATLSVQYYFEVDFTFTKSTAGQTGTSTASSTGTLTIYDFVDPAPAPLVGPDPEDPPYGDPTLSIILQQPETVSGTATFSVDDPFSPPTVKTDNNKIANFSTSLPLAGDNLTALGSETPGFVAVPISFVGSAAGLTSGNANVVGATFGGVVISMTYTFLPESDWAWAGLPLVFGAWAVRRRMANVKTA